MGVLGVVVMATQNNASQELPIAFSEERISDRPQLGGLLDSGSLKAILPPP